MIFFRLLRVTAHLIVALWVCIVIFPFADAGGRLRRIRQWSAQLLAICRVQVEIDYCGGSTAGARALLVANHVSWLDIFVINSMCPHRFVAKSDIRDWPLIGWLCARVGTVFIARGSLRDVRRIFEDLVASIRDDEHIAFFPEGTTAAQGTLLPFHANLFEAAIDAHVAIQPCALRYLTPEGNLHPAADFIGDMTFAESVLAILRGANMTAHLIVLPLVQTDNAHRRELAAQARVAIAKALGYPN
jgi:1-acyl-sn-glycerol-3-phosphate acyltransferase